MASSNTLSRARMSNGWEHVVGVATSYAWMRYRPLSGLACQLRFTAPPEHFIRFACNYEIKQVSFLKSIGVSAYHWDGFASFALGRFSIVMLAYFYG